MSQYYYAVSTLPLLSLDSDHFPSLQSLIDLCWGELSAADFALLLQAHLEPPKEGSGVVEEAGESTGGVPPVDGGPEASGRETLRAWIEWERALRNELVKLRAQRVGSDAVRHLGELSFVGGVFEVARDAMAADSPLEAERLLDRARWARLDELETGHHFDITKILIYSLRLQLLERRAQFTVERGREHFDALYASIMEQSNLGGFAQDQERTE